MADENAFYEIWEDAVEAYKAKTGRDITKDKSLAELQTTDELLLAIEAQNSKFEDFRDKKKKLWSALKATMQPVEVLSKLAKSALQGAPFGSAAAIFTAVIYLVASAKGVSEAYGSIADLLESLADFSDRLNEYSQADMDANLRKKVTQILATLLEIFAESEKVMTKGRLNEFGRVVFLGKDNGVEDALKRLESLTTSETRLVTAKTYATTNKIDQDVERMTALQNESKKEKTMESNLKILSTALYSEALVKVSETHARIVAERQEGSGEWLKSERLYNQWLKGDVPSLFILGGPGSGKSFLAGAAIEHIFQRNTWKKGSSRVSTGFFYIHEDDTQLRSLNTILKTVAFQIQERNPIYANYLVKVCSNSQKIITAAETWKSLFLDFFGAPTSQYGDNSAFIVLDGLDEAPRKERETFFKLLKDLEDLSTGAVTSPRLRVMVIGRPDLRDDTVFIWDKPIIYIEVSERKTKDDIVNYIKSSVGRVRALSQAKEPLEKRKQLRQDIIKKLSAGAQGMFLWVNLMMDNIYDMSRPSQIYEALDKAPMGLYNMIHHAFKRLSEDLRGFRPTDLNEILTWVTCAQRPLTLDELDSILRLCPPLGEGVPDLENRLRDQFASFFTLKRKDGFTTEALLERAAHASINTVSIHSISDTESSDGSSDEKSDKDVSDTASIDDKSSGDDLPLDRPDPYNSPFSSTTITFSHASIRDYLVRESNPSKREFPADLGIGVNIPDAEKHITITCLKVLTEEAKLPYREDDSEDETDSESSESDTSDDGKSETHSDEIVFDLEDYAADHFIHHLKLTDRASLTFEEQETITRNLLKVFTYSDATDNWIDGIESLEDFGDAWIGSDKHGEWVRGWFIFQISSNEKYSDKEKDELKNLSESDEVLLQSFAIECAKRWLYEDSEDYTVGFVSFLDRFVPDPENEGRGKKDISELRLRKLADFADLTKTTVWHSNFGEEMRLEEHLDTAINHLEAAIELDNRNWRAMGRLSFCYESREFWELAMEWSRKALANCPDHGQKSKKSEYWRTISLCSLEIFDYAQAKDAAKQACLLQPEDGSALSTYIFALDAVLDHEELMNYAESLQARMAKDDDENLLTMALLADDSLSEVLGHAARVVGKLDLVIDAAYTACEAALKDEDLEQYADQQLILGQLLYTHNRGEQKAIELWESVLKNKEAYFEVTEKASDHLSEIYYREAVAAERKGKNPRPWISKLEKLAKYSTKTKLTEASGASLMLGLWFREHDKLVEAKMCCYANVISALDLLSNPGSDLKGKYAWTNLGAALLHAGDFANAAAAYSPEMETICSSEEIRSKSEKEAIHTEKTEIGNKSISKKDGGDRNGIADELLPHLKDLNIRTEDSQDLIHGSEVVPAIAKVRVELQPAGLTKGMIKGMIKGIKPVHPPMIDRFPDAPALPGNASWYCDGLCRRKASSWKELYICEVCLDSVCFCEICIELVKNEKLPFKVCSADHVFYKALPVVEVLGTTKDGKLTFGAGEAAEDLLTFLQRVRREWKDAIST